MFDTNDLPHAEAVVHLIAGLSYDALRTPCVVTRSLTVGAKELMVRTKLGNEPKQIVLEVSGSLIEHEGQTRSNVFQALRNYLVQEGIVILSGKQYSTHYRFSLQNL